MHFLFPMPGVCVLYCCKDTQFFQVILEFLQAQTSICVMIVWCRELGFALFYGAVVLKIHRYSMQQMLFAYCLSELINVAAFILSFWCNFCNASISKKCFKNALQFAIMLNTVCIASHTILFFRNLFEHRVRKAHHVYIKEKDLLKYLLCIVAFTVIGLVAWTVTAVQAAPSTSHQNHVTPSLALLSTGRTQYGHSYVICTFFHWNVVWHTSKCRFWVWVCRWYFLEACLLGQALWKTQ